MHPTHYQLPRSGRNVDPSSEKYKEAEKLIWELRANGKNGSKDVQPGTFGELLRQGTVHLRADAKGCGEDAHPAAQHNIEERG
ncbi:hypothetical protein BDV35DRAFT_393973 [Aspergillus flavus]|uniref:Uncharacterized protein n=1 Tax=Aspergillus flavus TaxID=5059 RepID=A0A5N6GV11_ASPFL|nr:hypothetical protein BDV35DRAFT_393973 [Aspergillus flavus]